MGVQAADIYDYRLAIRKIFSTAKKIYLYILKM